MYRALTVALLFFLMVAPPLSARMYQWVDADTGTPQLSGRPPPWYRGGEPGPRVFVIEGGRIIDDTALPVADGRREALRRGALMDAEEEGDVAGERALAEKRWQASGESQEAAIREEDDIVAGQALEEAPQPEDEDVATDEDRRQRQALIEQWERQRAEDARKLIEQAGEL